MDSKTETVRSDPVPSSDKLTLCITVNDSLPDMPSVSKGEGENGSRRRKEKNRQDTSQIKQTSEEIHCKQENAKRKGSDANELAIPETEPTLSGHSDECKQALTASKTNAIAFNIPTGQAVCRPPPKRFCNLAKSGRENASIERLMEKQRKAEKQKNQHMEQRLKRILDRQEAARKLAHNVEILLHQRSIAIAGRGSSHNTPQMTSSELLATAHHVAKDFRTLTSQMKEDFAVDDKNNNLTQKSPSCNKTQEGKHSLRKKNEEKQSSVESSKNDNNRGIAFTVGFDDDKQPLSPVPKALQVTNKPHKSRLTAQELEEKQRKAEERRNQRQRDRVKRVIANREALFKLASDLETFMIWNDTEGYGPVASEDGNIMRHQYQAAQLANDIADGFEQLSERYTRDLKQADGFSCTYWSPKQ